MGTAAVVAIVIGGLVLVVVALLAVAGRGRRPKKRLCGQCRRAMLPAWERCMFCGWARAPRLEFLTGPLAGQTLEITDIVTTIGSVAGNSVVLADPAVSRKHVGIRNAGGIFELADLGSTNGVYVNGHKMPKKTLSSGDILRIGNTEMVFRRD